MVGLGSEGDRVSFATSNILGDIKIITQKYVVVVVQSLSCARLFATPWAAARQASLSFTISQSLLKLMSIESVMPSNLYRPALNPCSSPSPLRSYSPIILQKNSLVRHP